MRLPRCAWSLAVAAGCSACTIGPSASDAGAADAGSQLVSDQCNMIFEAFCNRAIGGCGVPDTLSQCIADELPTCCVGTTCDRVSQSPPSALDACTSALASEDCYSVATVGPSAVPACQGIPQP
ncbi:MAG TPA: hypothetical protein VE987_11445 [Polyangiaceae bacterium]|nr:hypothetical protein [Polyangiaceae bacterium]